MASIVLGAVGGYFGGPLGFLIGSAFGQLLFPGKGQEGPRLNDLKLSGSSYGEMVPYLYGTVRIAGKVIWQTDLVEHKHTSGGKGGPQVTTYSYTASWAMLLCTGPIAGIRKIWWNKTLVYDPDQVNTTLLPITLYLGTETQLPDPTIEATEGVGNVPANRGYAYIVFTDKDLSDGGNTIGSWEFEVIQKAGNIPWRVSYAIANPETGTPDGGGPWGATYDGTDITIGKFFNHSGNVGYEEQVINGLTGAVVTPATTVNLPLQSGASLGLVGVVANLNVALCWWNPGSGGLCGWFTKNVFTHFLPGGNPTGASVLNALSGQGLYMADFIYAVAIGSGTTPVLVKWSAPGGIPGEPFLTTTIPSGAGGDMKLGICFETSKIFVIDTGAASGGTPVPSYPTMWRYADDLTLEHTWAWGDLPTVLTSSLLLTTRTFVVYKNILCAHVKVSATQYAYAWQINGDESFTQIGTIAQNNSPIPAPITDLTGTEIHLSGGLVLSDDGVISLDPPVSTIILAEIVADISTKCSVPSYDVSQLTDLVDGYVVGRQMNGRDMISPLQKAYFFDEVESSGVAKFVKRGLAPVVTILDNDLAAQTGGGTPPPIITIARAQEVDLPQEIEFSYMNIGAAYQQGTQYGRRLITSSKAHIALDFPIVLSDNDAKAKVDTLLWNSWMERTSYKILTSRKYAYLEPTDVIVAHGLQMRVTNKSDVSVGIMQLDCVADNSSIWNAGTSGVGASSGYTTPVVPSSIATKLIMLDLPLVTDADASAGYYAAMYSSTGSTQWSARLYKSVDSGTTYAEVDGTATPGIVGTTTNALGNWTGGNFVDEANILTVVVGAGGGTLSSVSYDTLLNGGNRMLVGSEIIGYRDAVLTAVSTYKLTGLSRGRRGTEWASGTHFAGERFVVLPTSMNPAGPTTEIQMPVKFKGVTKGAPLAGATVVDFTNNGNALKCYAPVQLSGGTNVAGDVTLQWVRRTRIGGTWLSSVDVPLSESSESYVVQIWDASYELCARIITATTQTVTYTSAQQVTDFGAQQLTIYFTVAQVGFTGIGVNGYGTAVGAGGSNGLPITPIAPYQDNPIVSPPPPAGGAHPIDHVFTQPDDTQYLSLVVGQTWVGKFTTTASGGVYTGAVHRIQIAEYAGPTLNRRLILSSDSGGLTVLAASAGSTCTIELDGVTLSNATAYYVITDFYSASGYPAPVGSAAGSLLNLFGVKA